MANGTDDIIIKGGSAEVRFNPLVYLADQLDPRSHKNADLKITRVLITGDISYDSGEHPSGLQCEITAFCD
jgi:hypothetical protein